MQVCAGCVQLGLRGARQGIAWRDVGAAASELGDVVATVPLVRAGKPTRVGRKAAIDPICRSDHCPTPRIAPRARQAGLSR